MSDFNDDVAAPASSPSPWSVDPKEGNVNYGQPGNPQNGYFTGGVGEQGFKYGTFGGGNTGNLHIDNPDSLSLNVGEKNGDTTVNRGLTLSKAGDNPTATNNLQLTMPQGSAQFSQSQGIKTDSLSLNASQSFGASSLHGGFSISHDDKGETDRLNLGGSTRVGTGTGSADLGLGFGPNGATSQSLSLGWQNPDLKLGANFDATQDGKGGSTFKLGENAGSKSFAERMSVGGASNGDANLNAGGTVQLAPKLYLGGYGDLNQQGGKQSWDAGGGLTYMPSPNLGITAAGGYGSGGYGARLEADLYKNKVDGAADLQNARNRPTVDIYLQAGQGDMGGVGTNMGAGDGQLNQRIDAGGSQIQGGVGFRF